MRIELRHLRFFLISALLFTPAALFARFSETLSAEQRTSCGLSHLTDDQLACVDAIVQRELAFARQGRTKAFAKTFTQRRTDSELNATGLRTLSEAEAAALDTQVAAQLASTPVGGTASASGGAASFSLPKPRSSLEVHGSVSLMMGATSHGGSFYGGAFETTVSDRGGHFDLTVGYSEMHGKGLGCLALYPWDDGYYYYHPYRYGAPFYPRRVEGTPSEDAGTVEKKP